MQQGDIVEPLQALVVEVLGPSKVVIVRYDPSSSMVIREILQNPNVVRPYMVSWNMANKLNFTTRFKVSKSARLDTALALARNRVGMMVKFEDPKAFVDFCIQQREPEGDTGWSQPQTKNI